MMHGEPMSDFSPILVVKTQKIFPHLDGDDEKESEPDNGGGIFWEDNGQPIAILQRGKEADAVADEDLLLGWDMKEKKFCGQLIASNNNLLTVF